jgi:hypothetical protein
MMKHVRRPIMSLENRINHQQFLFYMIVYDFSVEKLGEIEVRDNKVNFLSNLPPLPAMRTKF